MLGRLGRKLNVPRLAVSPRWERYLRFLRYLLFALSFLGLGIVYFLGTPYSQAMGFLGGSAGAVTLGTALLTGAFLALSLFTDRPFCRYFCVEGARYGTLSLARLFTVKRNGESCTGCGKCDRSCPMGITVSRAGKIRNGQCINCFECIRTCPVDRTLTYGWAFSVPPINREKENEKAE